MDFENTWLKALLLTKQSETNWNKTDTGLKPVISKTMPVLLNQLVKLLGVRHFSCVVHAVVYFRLRFV